MCPSWFVYPKRPPSRYGKGGVTGQKYLTAPLFEITFSAHIFSLEIRKIDIRISSDQVPSQGRLSTVFQYSIL